MIEIITLCWFYFEKQMIFSKATFPQTSVWFCIHDIASDAEKLKKNALHSNQIFPSFHLYLMWGSEISSSASLCVIWNAYLPTLSQFWPKQKARKKKSDFTMCPYVCKNMSVVMWNTGMSQMFTIFLHLSLFLRSTYLEYEGSLWEFQFNELKSIW